MIIGASESSWPRPPGYRRSRRPSCPLAGWPRRSRHSRCARAPRAYRPRARRLVRHDDDEEAGAIQGADRVDGPGKERDVLEAVQVMDVLDHRAVAIEKDGWSHKVRRAATRTDPTSMPRMQR